MLRKAGFIRFRREESTLAEMRKPASDAPQAACLDRLDEAWRLAELAWDNARLARAEARLDWKHAELGWQEQQRAWEAAQEAFEAAQSAWAEAQLVHSDASDEQRRAEAQWEQAQQERAAADTRQRGGARRHSSAEAEKRRVRVRPAERAQVARARADACAESTGRRMEDSRIAIEDSQALIRQVQQRSEPAA